MLNRRAYAAALIALPLLALSTPTYLNLDFETTVRGQPWAWTLGGPAYEIAIDNSASNSGTQSLRIRYAGGGQFGATALQNLPLAAVSGKTIRFSGYLKTDGITQGNAGLWLRVDGSSSTLSFDSAPTTSNGTTGWQQFVIERAVNRAATQVILGAAHFGNGTAWFDNFSLEIDGKPYVQAPPLVGEPTAFQLGWLQHTAEAFVTERPGNGFDDLAPIGRIAGGAHIVGLGEGTHGSAEFFHMKHRLVEYLATQKGFTIFSMEASMPEAYALNDYLLNGIGDPARLLQGLGFWTWNTQEVLDMILWMRQFNLSGKGRLQFTGFDMQSGTAAMNIVRTFVTQADPGYLPTLNAVFAAAATVQSNYVRQIPQSTPAILSASDRVNAVRQYLIDHRDDYLAKFPAATVDWAIQSARVAQQATYYPVGGTSYRDQSMATNLEWILQQNPGTRVIVWAHDYHISRANFAMGSYVGNNHGKDYVAVGQIFHAGRYNAYDNGRLMVNEATTSFPGSIEYVMHSTGLPRFFLDLKRLKSSDYFHRTEDLRVAPGAGWLIGPVMYRTIGAIAGDGFFLTYQLPDDFDALIFFDRVIPSELLPFN